MILIDFLTRPIAYHPVLARLLGSVPAAVMLSQAIYWQQRVPKERPSGCPGQKWWYHTIEDWESETALKRHEQLTARKILKKTSFWNERRKGIPARLWFMVDFSELEKTLKNQKIAMSWKTCLLQCREQDGRYAADRSAESRQTLYTETTSKITTTNNDNCNEKQVVVFPSFNSKSQSLIAAGKTNELKEQKTYLRLAQIYGGIHSPVGFKLTKKKQWLEQGMSAEDKQQLSDWVKQEQKAVARAKARKEQLCAQEQQDQQLVKEAVELEKKVLDGMLPDLRQAILSAKCGGKK